MPTAHSGVGQMSLIFTHAQQVGQRPSGTITPNVKQVKTKLQVAPAITSSEKQVYLSYQFRLAHYFTEKTKCPFDFYQFLILWIKFFYFKRSLILNFPSFGNLHAIKKPECRNFTQFANINPLRFDCAKHNGSYVYHRINIRRIRYQGALSVRP